MKQSTKAVLQFMKTLGVPATYQQVSKATGLKSPKSCLSKLKTKGLVDNTIENQWVLTTKGVKQLNEQPEQPIQQPSQKAVGGVETPTLEAPPVTLEDLFRNVGQNLWFPKTKDQAKLEAITFYVGRMTGFSDPTEIWNALCDYGLTMRAKYTWLKMFVIQAGLKMPEEVEEKYNELIGNELI